MPLRRKNIFRVLAALGLVLFASACARYFGPNIHLARYATAPEIVGTWTLSVRALGIVKGEGYVAAETTPHQIIFRADGTCDFQSITQEGFKAVYRNSPGSWRLEHDTGHPGEIKKNEVFISIDGRRINLYLTEEKRRIVLWDYWGDPDDWALVRYERKG